MQHVFDNQHKRKIKVLAPILGRDIMTSALLQTPSAILSRLRRIGISFYDKTQQRIATSMYILKSMRNKKQITLYIRQMNRRQHLQDYIHCMTHYFSNLILSPCMAQQGNRKEIFVRTDPHYVRISCRTTPSRSATPADFHYHPKGARQTLADNKTLFRMGTFHRGLGITDDFLKFRESLILTPGAHRTLSHD